MDILNLTLVDASKLLENGEITSVELCKAYLDRVNNLDKDVKAFIKVDENKVLEHAKLSDERRAQGKSLSRFDGIPVGIKDNICVEGEAVSCASKILAPVKSPYDATVIKKLKAQGIIPFGRANMDEFAMGSSSETSAFQKTSNPWDLDSVPGGSSGGSAAAVAARLVPAALGSDTGGSIRQPASFCGIVGFKPTYGRVSRFGLTAFASSLDQIGPMTNNVLDAAAILDIIGGVDKNDATTLPEDCSGFLDSLLNDLPENLDGIKIGLPKEYYEVEGISEETKQAMEQVKQTLSNMGAEFVDISLPNTKYAIATYYVLATAEASANLARFDGVRYGDRKENQEDLIDTYFQTRGEGFGYEVKRRIILGTYVLSSGYYDAYYLRAQKVRTLIRKDFENAFEECDVILTPVTPATAFKFGAKSDPISMYLSDIFTIALNLAGNCGISVPASLGADSNMPVGAQFIAPSMGENALLKVARLYEVNREKQDFIPNLDK
jgi:aspartyl-tRNA(Asn)/glutamyl-tRNA(Gln) amidotransferase subunit A